MIVSFAGDLARRVARRPSPTTRSMVTGARCFLCTEQSAALPPKGVSTNRQYCCPPRRRKKERLEPMDRNPNILTKAAIELVFQSGLSRAFAKWFAGRGAVYMFHSIVPDRSACLAPGLATSAAFLDRLLTSFRRSGIDIIAVTDLMPRLESPNGRHFV